MIQVWKVVAGLVHSAYLDGDFFDQDELSFLFSLVKMLSAYSIPLDLKIAQDKLHLLQPTSSVIFNHLCGICLCIYSIQFLLSYSIF